MGTCTWNNVLQDKCINISSPRHCKEKCSGNSGKWYRKSLISPWMYTWDILEPWPRSPHMSVLDRTTYKHMKQSPRSWMLTEAHTQMLTEARALKNWPIEIQARMLAEACAQLRNHVHRCFYWDYWRAWKHGIIFSTKVTDTQVVTFTDYSMVNTDVWWITNVYNKYGRYKPK